MPLWLTRQIIDSGDHRCIHYTTALTPQDSAISDMPGLSQTQQIDMMIMAVFSDIVELVQKQRNVKQPNASVDWTCASVHPAIS